MKNKWYKIAEDEENTGNKLNEEPLYTIKVITKRLKPTNTLGLRIKVLIDGINRFNAQDNKNTAYTVSPFPSNISHYDYSKTPEENHLSAVIDCIPYIKAVNGIPTRGIDCDISSQIENDGGYAYVLDFYKSTN